MFHKDLLRLPGDGEDTEHDDVGGEDLSLDTIDIALQVANDTQYKQKPRVGQARGLYRRGVIT